MMVGNNVRAGISGKEPLPAHNDFEREDRAGVLVEMLCIRRWLQERFQMNRTSFGLIADDIGEMTATHGAYLVTVRVELIS